MTFTEFLAISLKYWVVSILRVQNDPLQVRGDQKTAFSFSFHNSMHRKKWYSVLGRCRSFRSFSSSRNWLVFDYIYLSVIASHRNCEIKTVGKHLFLRGKALSSLFQTKAPQKVIVDAGQIGSNDQLLIKQPLKVYKSLIPGLKGLPWQTQACCDISVGFSCFVLIWFCPLINSSI